MAMLLKLRADILERNKLAVLTHDIPYIFQFLAVVALILAAIGSGYDIIGMFGITGVTHNEPVPWLTAIFELSCSLRIRISAMKRTHAA